MFNSITLFLKPELDEATQITSSVIAEYAIGKKIPISVLEPENINEKSLFISIGGDGTMLGAMRAALKYPNVSILGFNTGTFGFLSEEIPADLTRYIDNVLNKNGVLLEERMVLEGTVSVDGIKINETFKAINEFLVTGKSISDPLVTEVFINKHFVTKQLGNGVLVSTSTGSTAMSLSAGGVIVSPSTNIMQIVPLVAHTLTSRPIISTGRDSITIKTKLSERIPEVEIHGDGQVLMSVNLKNKLEVEIMIKKHPTNIKIWRPEGWNFFNVLANKMKW